MFIQFSAIISLFAIFTYIALGTYILRKNPYERTNQIFVLLMLAFVMWSVGTYSIGLVAENTPLNEVLLYTKLQLSGVVLAFTVFIFFGLSVTKKEGVFKNPLIYLITIPALYLLNLIWTSDVSGVEPGIFSTMALRKQELFLYSAIFGLAGVYLLLRHYMTSKYRQREQAKIISAGAILAVLIAITSNVILPMFSGVYLLPLSTLAPAVMGMFFAYAVYQYGLFIRPMPEISASSFCGVECTLCADYVHDKCPACRLYREKYAGCEVYKCLNKKGHKDCGDCQDILTCQLRKGTSERCFTPASEASMAEPKCEMSPGSTYFVKDEGYDIFIDAVKCGAFGFVASTTDPQQIKEKYGLSTTPMVWISDEVFEMGVKPKDLKRLSSLIINFMKKTNNAVVFLDGIDMLISINGFSSVQPVVQVLSSTAQATSNSLIISTGMENEVLSRLKPLFFTRRKHERPG